ELRLRRGAPEIGDEQGAEGRAARTARGGRMTDLATPPTGASAPVPDPPTGADGRALRDRGARTRARLLEAAESVFAQLGYHDASIVKITEAAGVAGGTFYLYFQSKKDVFEEVVLDLNRRVRHFVQEAAK